jgi:beta-phosphoglucomutase-like phosphatase (HAD superfamily)
LPKGVIFDVDGTILDGSEAHALSWVEASTQAGYDVPFDVVRSRIGMGADLLAHYKASLIGGEIR